jgi:lantibiotic modifying enzyme
VRALKHAQNAQLHICCFSHLFMSMYYSIVQDLYEIFFFYCYSTVLYSTVYFTAEFTKERFGDFSSVIFERKNWKILFSIYPLITTIDFAKCQYNIKYMYTSMCICCMLNNNGVNSVKRLMIVEANDLTGK